MMTTSEPLTTSEPQVRELLAFRAYVEEKMKTHRWSLTGLARCSQIAVTTLTRALRRDPANYRLPYRTKKAILEALDNYHDNYTGCSHCHGSGYVAKP